MFGDKQHTYNPIHKYTNTPAHTLKQFCALNVFKQSNVNCCILYKKKIFQAK